MKITLIVVKLLFLGALFIISNNNLHLAVATEREVFVDTYSAWFSNLVAQGVEVTGYVVKFEWLPQKDMSSGKTEEVIWSKP